MTENRKGLNLKKEFVCSHCHSEHAFRDGLSIIFETVKDCRFHIEHQHLIGDGNPTPIPIFRFYRASDANGFMSNLFQQPVFFEGKEFTTAEAAYQYGKPKDLKVAEWIVSAPKPHLCAMAAHGLLAFDIVKDWQIIKVGRMRAVLEAKFSRLDYLRMMLLATGDAILIEESNTDSFWGIGKKRNGANMLGKLLMELRTKLASQGIHIKCPHCQATLPVRDAGSIYPNCHGIIPNADELKDWWGVKCIECNCVTFNKRLNEIKECGYCGNKDRDRFINVGAKDFS